MPDNIVKTAVDKTPETIGFITYAWVCGVSAFGGYVAFSRKVKMGHARAWNFAEFIGEIATSVLAGCITFWLCQYTRMDPWLTAALVAITGHMGSRAIFMLENWASSKFPATPTQQEGGAEHEKF
jgi:hypothetical protein